MKKLFLCLLFITSLVCCSTNETNKVTLNNIASSIASNYNNPPKVKGFINVEDLRELLASKTKLTEFNSWRFSKFSNGEKKWTSNTNITQFGTHSKNGVQNDIGYSIIGKEERFVNEIQLTLNIKNAELKKEAMSNLAIWSEWTLEHLNLETPIDLKSRTLNGQQYCSENENCYILLKKSEHTEKNLTISNYSEVKLDKFIDYEKWTFIIKSK